MRESRTYHGNTPSYNILTDAEVQRILGAVFQLMREIGIRFDKHERAMDLLSEAGCDISSEGIVKFPTDLVKSSIASAGKSVKVWNRPGTEFVEFSNENSSFYAGVTAVNVIDVETGEHRPSTQEDLAMVTRVADALPNIDGVALPCKMTERPNVQGEIEEFAVMAANTTKPLHHFCESPEALEGAIEIAAAIRGGRDRLREKPYFSFAAGGMPLYYAKPFVDQLFLAVENGIPSSYGTMLLGGATAPITHAGTVVNQFAVEFTGVVLAQLIDKGCFCLGGSTPAFIDPSTGLLGGYSEISLADMAVRQISRVIGIPTVACTGGASISLDFNQQSAAYAALSMTQAIFSRATQQHGLGVIEAGLTYSLHALLFCDELAGFVRHLSKGIKVDDETLALDVTKAVGHGCNFLSEMHTAAHCRDFLRAKYLRAMFREQWEEGGRKDLKDIIDEDLRKILATHTPEPLPASVQDQINAILKKYGAV